MLQQAGDRRIVLVVDDEDLPRAVMVRILEEDGYTVLEAADGRAGLDCFRRHRDAIRLVISDLRMPGMGGQAMADAMRAERPDLSVLFCAGYPHDVARAEGLIRPEERYLPKPYRPEELSARALALCAPA